MTVTVKTDIPSGWSVQTGPTQISTNNPSVPWKLGLDYDAMMLRFKGFFANLRFEITLEDDQKNGNIGSFTFDVERDPDGERYVIFQDFGFQGNGSPRTNCVYSVKLTNLDSSYGTSVWHWGYTAKHAPVERGSTLWHPWITSRGRRRAAAALLRS